MLLYRGRDAVGAAQRFAKLVAQPHLQDVGRARRPVRSRPRLAPASDEVGDHGLALRLACPFRTSTFCTVAGKAEAQRLVLARALAG